LEWRQQTKKKKKNQTRRNRGKGKTQKKSNGRRRGNRKQKNKLNIFELKYRGEKGLAKVERCVIHSIVVYFTEKYT
jgi:hypothetical protein